MPNEFEYCDKVITSNSAEFSEIAEWLADNNFGWGVDWNKPPFRIALNRPLKDFTDTVWVHRDKIFQPSSGCNNVNNQLKPYSNPLI
jgi:hypothetical protein